MNIIAVIISGFGVLTALLSTFFAITIWFLNSFKRNVQEKLNNIESSVESINNSVQENERNRKKDFNILSNRIDKLFNKISVSREEKNFIDRLMERER